MHRIGLMLSSILFVLSASAEVKTALPERIESAEFNAVLADAGGMYVAGQPTEAGLRWAKEAGVSTVVVIRTQREMDNRKLVPFDEAALLDELGMEYVHIPIGGQQHPYTPELLARFDQAVAKADGKVLLHCASARRASYLWAAWQVSSGKMDLNDAVRSAEAINMDASPLEALLGREIELNFAEDQ